MTAPGRRPVSVVIGGGSGIGSACARRLGRRGDLVVVVDPGVGVQGEDLHEPTAAQTAAAIREEGGDAVHHTVSVTDRAAIEALFGQLRDEHGSIEAIVNTAGILRYPPLPETDEGDWTAVLDVHFNGYLNVLSAALPDMIRSGRGRVVGFTSGVGLARTSAGAIAYGVAKRAVAALTWQLGSHLPAGVTVNALSPIAATRMVRGTLVAGGASPAGLDLAAMPQAEDMAPAADWLTSDRTGWLSGQVVFSAGSELSLIEPPRLVEAVRTENVLDFGAALDALVPVLLAPAEQVQQTGGGSNPRLHDVFRDPTTFTRSGPPQNWLIVGDQPSLAAPVAAALAGWGADFTEVVAHPTPAPDLFGYAEHAVATAAGRRPLDGMVIVAGPGSEEDRSEDGSWLRVLRDHAKVTSSAVDHASWLRAAARYARDTGRPVRTVHVVPATTPAGRTVAQAVAQMCRSANDTDPAGPLATVAVSLETADPGGLIPFGHLVARLACSEDTLALKGAELVAAPGWIGLRRHPAPALTYTFGGPDIPAAAEETIRQALGPARFV
jgi:NAD(P)-dependent dehydrogenase (short-subunit alcohol dehydrogenase family)